MSIKIPISAEFNGDAVKSQIEQVNSAIKRMGDSVAKASRQKFEPITLTDKEDLNYFLKQSEKLLKIQGELKNRMEKSGQGGKNPINANWNHLYLNENTKLKRQKEMLLFFGNSFTDAEKPSAKPDADFAPIPRPSSRAPRKRVGFDAATRESLNVVQAGLGAFGPVGGVASGALNKGINGGFGAGLAGLAGGLAALGLSKVIGSVMDKVGQAEDNNTAYDTLKRTLGDVNVSFSGLKEQIHSTGMKMGVTFDEVGRLSTQYVKGGNLTADDYSQIAPEMETSIGMARGFGLDPSITTGILSSLRGMKITNNDQDTRRMAVLIGETIGRAGAFAKADEVMSAIAGYATMQTRQSLSAANISGYAGQLSALAGSGIAGLDPLGASNMLAQVNASLSNGGANGEASQFFSSMVANRMGLDPVQMMIMREGGAFATNNQMFRADSAASRYGISGPKGSSTFLSETLKMLREKYQDPGMLAMATSQHLGVGMNHAMTLLNIAPNEIGRVQAGLDSANINMGDLNSAGIANLAKIYSSKDSDLAAVAESLLRRTGTESLSADEASALKDVMANQSIDVQKRMLTELVASRDQERTLGSEARDTKNIVDNIKTSLADKLIPLTIEMRHGIMAIAGAGRGETPRSIQEKVIRAEFEDEINTVNARYDQAIKETWAQVTPTNANMSRVEIDELARQDAASRAKAQQKLKSERDAEVAPINARMEAAVEQLNANLEASRAAMTQAPTPGRTPRVSGGFSSGVGLAPASAGARTVSYDQAPSTASLDSDNLDDHKRLSAFLEAIASVEGANYNTIVGYGKEVEDFSQHPNYVGLRTGDGPSTAAGRYQITGTTWRGLKGLDDFSPESQDKAAIQILKQSGALPLILAGDNEGALAKLGGIWQGLPTGTSKHQGKQSQATFDRHYQDGLDRYDAQVARPAQLPANQPTQQSANVNVNVPPIEVVHRNQNGMQVAPTQMLQPTVSASKPFGN